MGVFNNSSTTLGENDSYSLSASTLSTPSSSWWNSGYPSGYSWPHIITGAIIITIIILMILIGNFLVIWAITHDRNLKTPQNLFIASLAFADFFIGLLIIPFSLTNVLLGYWLFGVVFCEIYKAVDVLLCTASIMSLCLISLDRYWSITRAVHYARQRTKKRAAIMIFIVWFISAVVSIPPLIGWKQPPRESEWPLCELSEDIGYVAYSACGSFYIPAFIMVFVLVKIHQAATQRARRSIGVKAPMSAQSDKMEAKAQHSTESSVDQCLNYPKDDTTGPDYICSDGNITGDITGDTTACETVYETTAAMTSEDETSPISQRVVIGQKDSNKSHNEKEYSNLLNNDSDMNRQQDAEYAEKVNRVKLAFESFPAAADGDDDDINSNDSRHLESTPATQSNNNDVASPSFNNGDQGNGPMQHFKIVELRANGTSTVAGSDKNNHKNSFFRSLRRHILSGKKSSHKRKESDDNKTPTDFQRAERHKKKLAKARERRATVVLGVVMATFLLCWTPFFTLYLVSSICKDCIPTMVFSVFFWIGYCNSVINPFIYTVFNRDFRRAFQKIVFGRRYTRP